MSLWNVPKKESGFTLVEMLAVTIIVGVVSAIAVPNLLGQLYKARITDGVASIKGAIEEAKKQAVRNSRSCSITIADNGAGRFTIQTTAGSNQCLLENRTLPEDVTVAISDSVDEITINSKGNIDYTNGGADTSSSPREFTVSHSNLGTSNEKCVRLEGLFGDVQTGIVQGGTCNTNL